MTEQAQEEGRLARMFAGRSRRWRGVAVAGVIAIVGTLSLFALQRPAQTDSRFAVVEQAAAPAAAPPDPLIAELIRCRTLPPQVDDPTCPAAWEENRRRFFGETRATRVPGDPLPAYAPIPAPGSEPAAAER